MRTLASLSCFTIALALAGCGSSDDVATPTDSGANDGSLADSSIKDGASDGSTTDAALDAAPSDAAPDGGVTGARRLFVVGTQGVKIWDKPDLIAADRAPDVALTDSTVAAARAVALHQGRLFVAGNQQTANLVVFDAPETIAANAVPAAKIPRSAFPATGTEPAVDHIVANAASDTVWTASFSFGTFDFVSAAAVTSSSTAKARFAHSFQQTPSVAYEPTAKHLFVGQISGAGLLAWNDPTTDTSATTQDFVVGNPVIWSLWLDGKRLYGGGPTASTAGVSVWSDATTITAPAAATFALTTGIAKNDFIADVSVHEGILAVCVQTGLSDKVLLWDNAAALTANAAPTATLTGFTKPKSTYVTKAGRLYVLDDSGVSIFASPKTASPTLVTKVTAGSSLQGTKELAILD